MKNFRVMYINILKKDLQVVIILTEFRVHPQKYDWDLDF